MLLLFPYCLIAGTLKGKVMDDKGALLPFATVFIQGTTIGTSAGGNAEYQLILAPGTYKILCQFIGYKQSSFSVTITGNEIVEHNFSLGTQSLKMNEFVVHASAEDPAYPIIRSAIGKRKFHLQQVKSFQSSIYLKGAMRTRKAPSKVMGQEVPKDEMGLDSTGKGVLYLCEEFADYYSEKPDKQRTVIHSVRESGNPNGVGFSQIPPVITFYENNINLFRNFNPRGFVSPISDGALFYYKYKLEGEFIEEGHTVYKIKVTPKRLYEPLFEGTIYIVQNDWAIHSLNVQLTKMSNLNFLDTIHINQMFLPLKEDTWVVKNQQLYVAIKIFGFDIAGVFATVYDKQKVNEPIPDTMFKNKVISIYDKTATKKDSSFWTQTRPIALEKDETRDYKLKDSIRLRLENPAYIDSMRRVNNKLTIGNILWGGSSFTTKGSKTIISTNSLLTMLNSNTVEGLSITPKIGWWHTIDTGKTLRGDVAVRYGVDNKHTNAITRISYTQRDRHWVGRQWTIGAEVGQFVFQYNPENPVLPLFNSLSTLFWRENDLKIYERQDAHVFFGRNYGNGFKWNVRLAYQQRIPLENLADPYTIADKKIALSDNFPAYLKGTVWEKHNAVLLNIKLEYQPGATYVQYPNYKVREHSSYPVFTFNYDKGIPNILESKTDYDKWRIGMSDHVRLRLLGTMAYNIAIGGFLNTNYVSMSDLIHLYGNRGIGFWSPYLRSFQFAPYYNFSNKENFYGEAHVEYYLKGLLTNKIPLLRQARWYFLFGTNSFYANDKDYYAEAFVGIDNLGYKAYRFLRVDFIQSYDSRGGRNSGIRLGLNFGSGVSVNLSDTNGEW